MAKETSTTVTKLIQNGETLEAYNRLYLKWCASPANSNHQALCSRYLRLVRQRHYQLYHRIIL